MFRKTVIGGTFDYLHLGHQRILDMGFQLSKEVIIGLTSDEFARRFKIEEVSPYEKRKKDLDEYIKQVRKFSKPYKIIKIEDNYGIATIDPDIDSIIVSEETLARAQEINAIRFKKDMNKLNIVVVPIVTAKNGTALSSNRIKKEKYIKDKA